MSQKRHILFASLFFAQCLTLTSLSIVLSAETSAGSPCVSTPQDSWACDPVVAPYRSCQKTEDMIDAALSHSRLAPNYQGVCLRFVNDDISTAFDLDREELTHGDGGNSCAYNAPERLGLFGFKNLMDPQQFPAQSYRISTAEDAPKGSILVYDWTPSSGVRAAAVRKEGKKNPAETCGHIEIKVDDGSEARYVSDTIKDHPISRDPDWTLRAVLINPSACGLRFN